MSEWASVEDLQRAEEVRSLGPVREWASGIRCVGRTAWAMPGTVFELRAAVLALVDSVEASERRLDEAFALMERQAAFHAGRSAE